MDTFSTGLMCYHDLKHLKFDVFQRPRRKLKAFKLPPTCLLIWPQWCQCQCTYLPNWALQAWRWCFQPRSPEIKQHMNCLCSWPQGAWYAYFNHQLSSLCVHVFHSLVNTSVGMLRKSSVSTMHVMSFKLLSRTIVHKSSPSNNAPRIQPPSWRRGCVWFLNMILSCDTHNTEGLRYI